MRIRCVVLAALSTSCLACASVTDIAVSRCEAFGGTELRVEDVPIGTLVIPSSRPYGVGHDSGGFFAIALATESGGCAVYCEPSSRASLIDPCHATTFALSGEPVSGSMSDASLPYLQLAIAGTGRTAMISVSYGANEVSVTPSTRVAAPR